MALAELHDRAPIHPWAASRAEIERAFGKPVEELFDSISHKALASGSIAQVGRGCASSLKRRCVRQSAYAPSLESTCSRSSFRLLDTRAAPVYCMRRSVTTDTNGKREQ